MSWFSKKEQPPPSESLSSQARELENLRPITRTFYHETTGGELRKVWIAALMAAFGIPRDQAYVVTIVMDMAVRVGSKDAHSGYHETDLEYALEKLLNTKGTFPHDEDGNWSGNFYGTKLPVLLRISGGAFPTFEFMAVPEGKW